MITRKIGGLFDTEMNVIGHGVNTEGLMGSGIAVLFRERFPKMHKEYVSVCKNRLLLPGDIFPFEEDGYTILNIASQKKPGRDATLERLESGILKSIEFCEQNGHKGFAIPRIGSGIGGLKWKSEVVPLLNDIAGNSEIEIETWILPHEVDLD